MTSGSDVLGKRRDGKADLDVSVSGSQCPCSKMIQCLSGRTTTLRLRQPTHVDATQGASEAQDPTRTRRSTAAAAAGEGGHIHLVGWSRAGWTSVCLVPAEAHRRQVLRHITHFVEGCASGLMHARRLLRAQAMLGKTGSNLPIRGRRQGRTNGPSAQVTNLPKRQRESLCQDTNQLTQIVPTDGEGEPWARATGFAGYECQRGGRGRGREQRRRGMHKGVCGLLSASPTVNCRCIGPSKRASPRERRLATTACCCGSETLTLGTGKNATFNCFPPIAVYRCPPNRHQADCQIGARSKAIKG